jgi:hypothetical protein
MKSETKDLNICPLMSRLSQEVACMKERDKLKRALEIAANTCGAAATFLEFHGKPSAQLDNCIRQMKQHEKLGLDILWNMK